MGGKANWQDGRRLNDSELAQANGGTYWDQSQEDSAYRWYWSERKYGRIPSSMSFEDFVQGNETAGHLMCRTEWLKRGKPSYSIHWDEGIGFWSPFL